MASKIPPTLMISLIEKILENDNQAYADLELFHAPSECGLSVYECTRRALHRALSDGGYTKEEFDELTQQVEFEGAWSYGGLDGYLEDKPWREYA